MIQILILRLEVINMCNTCGCKKAESFDAENSECINCGDSYDSSLSNDKILRLCDECGYCGHHGYFKPLHEGCDWCEEEEEEEESFGADDIYGVCPFCGYDAEAAVKYQMKQNNEEFTNKEYDEEVKFYLYESHPDFCKPMQKYVEDKSFEAQHYIDDIDFQLLKDYVGNLNTKEYRDFCYEFDIDFEDLEELDSFLMSNTSNSKVLSQLGIESFDEAMSDNVSFPEKEYEIDDRDIYNPDRAAMDMIRGNRALREEMEEQGVYVGRHPGYYNDNGRWVELMEHYDDYERIPNWLQGLVGVGLVGGLTYLLTKISGSTTDAGNNTNNTTE